MVDRVIICFGQSNMVGTGYLSELQTLAGTKWSHTGTYSNIRYFQHNLFNFGTITGQNTLLDFAASRYDAPPSSAYDYPVNYSHPQVTINPFLESFGPDLEFARMVQATLGEPVIVVKLAYGGTYISRIEPQNTDIIQYNWFWPNAHRSWHPSLPKDYTPYTETTVLTGTSTAVTPGDPSIPTPGSLTEVGAFTPSAHVGQFVNSGGFSGQILSNTADQLFVGSWYPDSGTYTPAVSAPAVGAYTIVSRSFFSASLVKVLMEDYLPLVSADFVVESVLSYIGESESIEEDRANDAYENMKAVMDYVRGRITLLTEQPANEVPWVMIGPQNNTGVWPYANITVQKLQELADNDPCCRYLDSTDFEFGGFTGSDQSHHSAQGIYDLSRAAGELWLELRQQVAGAHVNPYDSLSLSDIRTRVRRTLSGNNQSNTPTNQQIDQAANASQREICVRLGDKAWFLRRVETFSVNSGTPNTVLLPRFIRRLMRVENPNCPTQQIKWYMVSWEKNGRIRIKLPESATGDLNFHHMIPVTDLDDPNDKFLIPMEYSELLEVLTCWRLAKSLKSPAGVQIESGELERLWQFVEEDTLKHDRQRQDITELTSLNDPFSKYLAEPGSSAWY